MRRSLATTIFSIAIAMALTSQAFADECINASKSDQTAGAQIIMDFTTGDILFITPGLQERIDRGVVDTETGAGFHGIIAFDLNGDGVVDGSTWFGVGPDGHHIPESAQLNGPTCRGLTNLGLYFSQCLGT